VNNVTADNKVRQTSAASQQHINKLIDNTDTSDSDSPVQFITQSCLNIQITTVAINTVFIHQWMIARKENKMTTTYHMLYRWSHSIIYAISTVYQRSISSNIHRLKILHKYCHVQLVDSLRCRLTIQTWRDISKQNDSGRCLASR